MAAVVSKLKQSMMFCPRFSYFWYRAQYSAVRCSTVQYKTEQYAVLAVARGCWQLQRRVALCCGAAAEVGRLAPRQWRCSDCGGQEQPRSRDGEERADTDR